MAVTAFSVVNAQFTKIGGGLDFDLRVSNFINGLLLGIKAEILLSRLKVFIKSMFLFRFLPHLLFYFLMYIKMPDGYEKDTVTSMMFDINGHYVFNSLDRFEFYGLAGFNILFAGVT